MGDMSHVSLYIAFEQTPGKWAVKPAHGRSIIKSGLRQDQAEALVTRLDREIKQPRRFKR